MFSTIANIVWYKSIHGEMAKHTNHKSFVSYQIDCDKKSTANFKTPFIMSNSLMLVSHIQRSLVSLIAFLYYYIFSNKTSNFTSIQKRFTVLINFYEPESHYKDSHTKEFTNSHYE